jgi:hypothetical protein
MFSMTLMTLEALILQESSKSEVRLAKQGFNSPRLHFLEVQGSVMGSESMIP